MITYQLSPQGAHVWTDSLDLVARVAERVRGRLVEHRCLRRTVTDRPLLNAATLRLYRRYLSRATAALPLAKPRRGGVAKGGSR